MRLRNVRACVPTTSQNARTPASGSTMSKLPDNECHTLARADTKCQSLCTGRHAHSLACDSDCRRSECLQPYQAAGRPGQRSWRARRESELAGCSARTPHADAAGGALRIGLRVCCSRRQPMTAAFCRDGRHNPCAASEPVHWKRRLAIRRHPSAKQPQYLAVCQHTLRHILTSSLFPCTRAGSNTVHMSIDGRTAKRTHCRCDTAGRGCYWNRQAL